MHERKWSTIDIGHLVGYSPFIPALKELSAARPVRIAYPVAFHHVIKGVLTRAAEIIPRQEAARRKMLSSTASDVDEIIHFLSLHFAVPEKTVITAFPYRSYAIYLTRKHTPVSSTDIGRSFGNIACSALTKMAARLMAKMWEHKMLREEMDRIEKGLSDVNGCLLMGDPIRFPRLTASCSTRVRLGNSF